jgi:D-aminopeptidase
VSAVVYAITAGTTDTVTATLADESTGAYTLHALLAGDYDVAATAAGHDTVETADVTVAADHQTTGVDFTLTPSGGGG